MSQELSHLKIVIGNKTYSSWSLRGWLAAVHTGFDVEEICLTLDTPEFYTEIEKYSAARKVPTLIDGDTIVWDSAAIIDYCARLAPDKYWWPASKPAYAYARSMFGEMHSGFDQIRNHMPMNLKDHWTGLTFSAPLQLEIDRAESLFSHCRHHFGAGGDFLFGGFCAVDMMFAPLATRLDTYGVALNPTARAYVDALLGYSSFKIWKAAALEETDIVEIDQLGPHITYLG
jgi:glutathione S-transferase